MPQAGFEPTIPAFDGAKTVHVLDLAAIAIAYPLWVNIKHHVNYGLLNGKDNI
jgi:hypothetical protein